MAVHAGMPVPLFILSPPRSGSTLLQRILATHPAIATISETQLLLPFLYPLRAGGSYAEYNHTYTQRGFQHLLSEISGGEAAYLQALADFVRGLYGRAAEPGARYFLDKAGALSLVVDEIFRMFPDGKFVFLWRNPLSVISSLMQTWRRGRWNLHEHEIYLFRGIPALVGAYREHEPTVIGLRFEDLVVSPEPVAARVFEYLDLSPAEAVVREFSQQELGGGLGDQPGMRRYRQISTEPLEKWKSVLANPLRKAWCRRYLRFLGQDRLAVMGYERAGLLAELAGLPFSARYLASDLFRMPYAALFKLLDGRILRDKLEDMLKGRRIYLQH